MAYKPKKHEIIPKFLTLIGFYLLISITASSAEQTELTLAEAKSLYTIEIAKQIIWPNEENLKNLVIGVVGDDLDLIDAFKNKEKIIIRDKTISIEPIDISKLESKQYAIIFITKRNRDLNEAIFKQVRNTLIITEGRVDKELQMVSLITTRDQLKIKLNLDNLSKRGFEVSINLLEFAGTKEDLTEQLRDKELQLRDKEVQLTSLLSQVQAKETNLLKLNATLLENTKLLNTAKIKLAENQKTLDSNKQQLESLYHEIEKSKSEVTKNESDIALQKKLISQKQKELTIQELSVDKLKMQILENTKILKRQVSKIENQGFVIQSKQETIMTQRNWIIASLIVSIIFFVLIYFLLKASKARQKTNKELKQLNTQLYELATTDDMTKLYNRRYFLEQSQIEFTRQKRNNFRSVMLMIDIDHFKNINDTYGHNVGDEVIKSVAHLLKASMRKYDIVGRLGGEEFAMMLLDCDITLATEIAQRMCDKIHQQTIKFDDLSIGVTISIGLSQLNNNDNNIEQILIRADKALYEAKNNGRNQIVVSSESSK